MATSRPFTLAECFAWLNQNLTLGQLADLRSLSREEVWQAHFWLSPIIRENLLTNNEPLRQRLENSAFCDDPDIAGQITDAFWDHLQQTTKADQNN